MFSDYMNELMYRLRPLRELRVFPANAADIEHNAAEAILQEAERALRRDTPMPTLNDTVLRPASAAEKLRAVLRSLMTMALATQLTGGDRYAEKAADLMYALMEKSVWSMPDGRVPGAYACCTDVMAADIAETLAWADYIMRRQVNVKYPGLSERVGSEIGYRLIDRLLNRDPDEAYLNRQDGFTVAVLSRMLTAVLLSDADPRSRWNTVRQILLLLDTSLRKALPDGGNEGGLEGWLREAVPLGDALEMLSIASNREIDFRNDERLRRMAEYPPDAHLDKGFFVNPDGQPVPYLPGSALFRFGQRCGAKALMSLGAYLNREFPDREETTATGRVLGLLNRRELLKEAARAPERPGALLRATQLAAAHGEGFACALHGGGFGRVRADAGDVLLTYNGRPILVDMGPEARQAETHSLPQVGAFSVQKGHGGACDLDARFEQAYAQLSLNLKNAYLKDAGILSWERTVMLSRFEKSVRIVEAFDFARPEEKVLFRMVTAEKPVPVPEGYLIGGLLMRCEGKLTSMVESMLGGYRMTFTTTEPRKSANFSFVFTPVQ